MRSQPQCSDSCNGARLCRPRAACCGLHAFNTDGKPTLKGDKGKTPRGAKWQLRASTEDIAEAKAVFSREVLLDLIGRFIHLERGDGKEVLIFPRFQQFDAVRKLLADAESHGAGQNYLIQHSAGSARRTL